MAGASQVVLLAAGMDIQSLQASDSPTTKVFELDKQALFDIKEPILHAMKAQPACQRVVIPVDLATEDWENHLVEAGFDCEPTVWILEGLVYYIPADAVNSVLARVSRLSARGSTVVADMVSKDFMDSSSTFDHRDDMARRGAPWMFGHNDPAALFAAHGFRCQVLDLAYLYVDRRERRLVVQPQAVYRHTPGGGWLHPHDILRHGAQDLKSSHQPSWP
eukprot:jgi/Tetstr1/429365/TSEL_001913.t1